MQQLGPEGGARTARLLHVLTEQLDVLPRARDLNTVTITIMIIRMKVIMGLIL